MSDIFITQPGYAVAIPDVGSVPMVLDFSNWGGPFVRRSIVQSVGLARKGNYQFVHTLRNYVYVYVFGERMGDLTLGGISFAGRCPIDNTDGMNAVLDYYNNQGIAFSGKPVSVQVGAAGFRGFLVGARFQIMNPRARLGQFQLNFQVVPPTDAEASSATGVPGGG